MAFTIPEFDFKGIKRIEIPKRDADFMGQDDYGFSIIKKYLPNILATHRENARKIEFLHNYLLGEQDILAKERPHDVDKKNNNQIIENHANRQVEFKVGFLTGEQRDYTHKADTNSDDLIYLDRYFTDCNFFAKDSELKEWIYATGIGATHTEPRTDIIVSDGVDELTGATKTRYATRKEGFDVNFNAPFNFDCVDPKENFVVYSSARNKEPLFCVSYVKVDISKPTDVAPIDGYEILIETRYASFKFNSDLGFSTFYWNTEDRVEITAKTLHYLPIIEFSINKDRMGIIEKNRSCLNSINTLRSAVADMVVDNSNAILVFKNVDIEAEDVKAMKEAGAVIISDSNNAKQGSQADLKTITIEIPFDGLNKYTDQILQNCYDIAGVPMASGQVTSGGDTGQARLLGGGWNNAYIIINKEIQALLGYDYDQLKLILMLCKQVPNCPLDELFASQIDISYRINQNDNFMIKTQGMKYLYDMGMPLEFILRVGKLSNDIKTDAKEWQARIDKLKAEELAQQQVTENINVTDTNVGDTQDGNNSKE